jgi:putative transcriptional regulator
MKQKTLSQTLVDAGKDLGFSKTTVQELESLNLPIVRKYSAKEIKKLRQKLNASQGVFAAMLNINPSTVQKWEQGRVHPQNAALKLLNIIDTHGIKALV